MFSNQKNKWNLGVKSKKQLAQQLSTSLKLRSRLRSRKKKRRNVAKVIKIHWFIFGICSISHGLIYPLYPSPVALTQGVLSLQDEQTFQMRYNMSANSWWFQKYKPSNLKAIFVNPFKQGSPYLDRFTKSSFNFDGLYFWNQRELGDILYLI